VDEHQRRVVIQMLDEVARYRSGDIALSRLVPNLRGLMSASDFRAQKLIDDFWLHEAPIDGELELRTQEWAPPGLASDERLDEALDAFVRWVNALLADPDPTRA
jgi:hypothetical protein